MVQLGRALTDPKIDPPIRALVVYNSNPAVDRAEPEPRAPRGCGARTSSPSCVEQFLTDTARFADYVLPATSQLEHLDLLPSWGHEYLSLNQPGHAAAGRGGAEHASSSAGSSRRMGFTEPYLYESDEQLVRRPSSDTQAPVPRGRHLRAAAGARVGPPGPARALAALRQGRLPDAVRQVRVLLEEPARRGGLDPAAGLRAPSPTTRASNLAPGRSPWPS